MKNLSGCLTARLAETDEKYDSRLIEKINQRIKPPRPVGPGDVYIRAMYIVSDQVNSQGGCFAEEDLDHLATLLIDSPVMVGHQRDSLPLARNFEALKIEIDNRFWVKSYFYWMKDSVGAEDLRNNIDGGIYKECSISFLFTLPECSICGHDIRQCRHVPFREYEIEPGRREIAHFKYRNIEKVLETSLVFRGAVPETRITDDLAPDLAADIKRRRILSATHFFKADNVPDGDMAINSYDRAKISFAQVSDFKPGADTVSCYLAPYQPGIDLCIIRHDEKTEIKTAVPLGDNCRRAVLDILSKIKTPSFVIDALLYATKGKERLDGQGLKALLACGDHQHRLRLKFCDLLEIDGDKLVGAAYDARLDKLQSLLSGADHPGLEMRNLDKLSIDQWKHETLLDSAFQYKFGAEVITEDKQQKLSRFILTEKKLTPAVVGNLKRNRRGPVKCSLRLLDGSAGQIDITGQISSHLETGETVLLSRRINPGRGRRTLWMLFDILPGIEPHQIFIPDDGKENESGVLYAFREGDWVRLFFRDGKQWRVISVYNFLPPLFARCRRFLADIAAVEEPSDLASAVEVISLKSILRSGRMILIRPADSSTLFGRMAAIWLRPVLIDGEERYLFFGEGRDILPKATLSQVAGKESRQ